GAACLLYVGFLFLAQQWVYLQGSLSLSRTPEESAPRTHRKAIPVGELIGKVEVAGSSAVILEGVDERILSLAVGHVPGTALPGQPGRIALAGHRDSFFRGLGGMKIGSSIRLLSPRGKYEFQVVSTEIVSPEETRVLRPTSESTLTLITCYPFH